MSGPDWTDILQAVSAVAVAAFTGVLTWLGVVQARLLIRTAAISKTALTATRDSAQAALKAAEIAELNLVAVSRARIHFDKPSTLFLPNAPTEQHVVGIVSFIWRCSGLVAPENMKQAIGMRYDFTPLQPDGIALFDKLELGRAFVAPGGIIFVGSFEVTRGRFEKIKQGEAFLHFYGMATYNDGFANTPERRSTFCVKLEAGVPAADSKTDVAFRFAILGEHTLAN